MASLLFYVAIGRLLWSNCDLECDLTYEKNRKTQKTFGARKQTHNNKLISLYSWWYFGFSNLSWLRRSICSSGTQRFIAHTKPLTIRGLHHETRFKLWLQDPFKAHTKLLTIRRLHHEARFKLWFQRWGSERSLLAAAIQ